MAHEPRYVDGGGLGALIDPARNPGASAYLAQQQPSCHSDTGARSGEGCGDVVAYSPSFAQCRYVALITKGRVFALGLGQRNVGYRLPVTLRVTALATGASGERDRPRLAPLRAFPAGLARARPGFVDAASLGGRLGRGRASSRPGAAVAGPGP